MWPAASSARSAAIWSDGGGLCGLIDAREMGRRGLLAAFLPAGPEGAKGGRGGGEASVVDGGDDGLAALAQLGTCVSVPAAHDAWDSGAFGDGG